MTQQRVEKYRKPIRVLHWIHAGAFVLLFFTGLILFIPGLGFLAEDGWTRLIHRIGAAIFIIIPLIYLFVNPKSVLHGIKVAFTWSSDDIGWLKALPRYYFTGDESSMPPQGEMNTGQKLWWLIVLVFGLLFVITGLGMWFAKTSAPPGALQWMVFVHDISFIVAGAMFFVHIYNGLVHPLFNEAWSAITGGKISAEYAKKHHAKWYAEITQGKEES
ncbi:MAG: cytochrome b/b6 domain-containing protein [Dehalococcoidia bacterium]|jgi:formate dehydrogenase subunit gamma